MSLLFVLGFILSVPLAFPSGEAVVVIPSGKFTTLYGFGKKVKSASTVLSFKVDAMPVTRRDFYFFIRKNSSWSAVKIDAIYSDQNYLKNQSLKNPRSPITEVSWFAANAYCMSKSGRLPTVLEWEYLAAASPILANALTDPKFIESILAWYSKPSDLIGLKNVGEQSANFYGVYDLHGLIWEWTDDFNSVFVSGDNRQDGDKNSAAVCGAGATDATNRTDYAAFMRYAFRSSLEARYSQPNLGFRCAYSVNAKMNK